MTEEIMLKPGELYDISGEYAGPWGTKEFDNAMFVLKEHHTYHNSGDWFAFAYSEDSKHSLNRVRVRADNLEIKGREIYTPNVVFASYLCFDEHTPIVDNFIAGAKRLAKSELADRTLEDVYSKLNQTIDVLDEIETELRRGSVSKELLLDKIKSFNLAERRKIKKAIVCLSAIRTD